MPHPPYSSFSIERICALLCQQVRYCTLSILDSTLSKSRTTCQFRTDSEHQLTFLSQIKQKILKPLRFQDFSWSEWRDLNSRPLDPQSSALPNCATTRCARPVALASFPNSVDYLNGNLPALQEEIYIFFKPGESRRRSAPSIALRYARNCMALLRISSARRVLDMRGSSSTS